MYGDLMLYLSGVLTYPAVLFIWWVSYLLRFAFKDTYRVIKHGKLKEDTSCFAWLWIIPRVFIDSLWDTATMLGKRIS